MDLLTYNNAIEQHLWDAFNDMRGSIDHANARNYILGLLVLKRMYDVDEDEAVDWSLIASQDYDIGMVLNRAFINIEGKYPKLRGIFKELNYDSERIGNRQIRDKLWKGVISNISAIDMKIIDSTDLNGLSNLCIHLNELSWARSPIYFETPLTTIRLMTALSEPLKGATIYDPFCHSGITLISAAASTSRHDKTPELFGQTRTSNEAIIANLNMLLAGYRDAEIAIGDIIRQPGFIAGERVKTFDKILCTIPPGVSHWGDENARYDPYSRFIFGIPPATMGDFGYLQHCIASLSDGGMLVVAVLPGVLFRGRTEGDIRRRMIESDIFEAVIQLPPKLYAQTTVSFALLIIRRNKPLERKDKVLFINAKNDFLPIRSQNILRDQDIERIVTAYRDFKDIDGYCSVCSKDQIAKKQFHLDVPTYVVEKSVENMDFDMGASIKELDEIQQTKRDLYEHMQSNLERIIECRGRT
jgi:type I restriction enzyme M protein